MTRRQLVLLPILTIALAACAGGASSPGAGGAASGSGPVMVGSAASSLGTVLTGPNGHTLYVHAGDTATTSACTGTCAGAWPPLTVQSGQQAVGGTGVTGTFATLMRTDGTIQVTYNGMPLYYWQGDSKAGDTTGQGVNGFSVALAAAAAVPASGAPASAAPYKSPKASGYSYSY